MIVVQDSSANFASTAQYATPPVANGLQLLSFLNTSAAQCAKNYARNGCGSNGIVGSLTFNATSVTFPGTLTDYLQTGLIDTVEQTLIAVFNMTTYTSGKRVPLISNYAGVTGAASGTSVQRGLFTEQGATYLLPGYDRVELSGSPLVATEKIAQTGQYSYAFGGSSLCVIGTVSASDAVRRIDNMTAGVSATSAGTVGNAIDVGSPYRVGSIAGNNPNGFALGAPANISAIMAYNRRLNATERTTVYNWLKTLMSALYGVTI